MKITKENKFNHGITLIAHGMIRREAERKIMTIIFRQCFGRITKLRKNRILEKNHLKHGKIIILRENFGNCMMIEEYIGAKSLAVLFGITWTLCREIGIMKPIL